MPNFSLEAVASWEYERPVVDAYVAIPLVSLVFAANDTGYTALYSGRIRLTEQGSRDRWQEVFFADTLHVSHFDATQDYAPVVLRERMHAAPGDYVVEVVVTDEQSEQEARLRQPVEVRDIAPEGWALSDIWLDGRRAGGEREHLVSVHVPAHVDSVRAVIDYRRAGDDAADMRVRLLRLMSDTSVASPPYWFNPSQGSLAYWGVYFDRADTLLATRRPIGDTSASGRLVVDLPELTEGVYGIEVSAEEGSGSTHPRQRLVRDRLFAVMSGAFPAVTNLEQMIDALAYLADARELETIREAAVPEERKRRFDAFWGSLVEDREVAANLIELYYSRIEEANLLFTSHKEGWKTDRGMVYVVLGPPAYVEDRLDEEIWYYNYSSDDPTSTFVFERVRHIGRKNVFETPVLQRHPYYRQAWRRAVEQWRDGDVL